MVVSYHIHHNLLKTIIKVICNSVTLSINSLKVKVCYPAAMTLLCLQHTLGVTPHTGIIGNELADQVAKHVAKHPEAVDTGIKLAGHEGNPFHNIIWLAASMDGPNTQCLFVCLLQCPILDNGNQSHPTKPIRATSPTNATHHNTCIRSTN